MKKSQMIQLVKDAVGTSFGDRTVELHLSDMFSTIAGQLFAKDPGQFNYFTKRVTVPVVNRVGTLPVPVIHTPGNAKGVIRVMPSGADSCCQDNTEFQPIPYFALNSSTDANNQSWFVGYAVSKGTLRFTRSLPSAVTELLADVVAEFSAYDRDEDIQLPSGVEQMIVDSTVQAFKNSPAYSNVFKTPKQ